MEGPTKLSKAFGRALKRRREAAGLSQEGLAEDCGLHRTHVSLLERGMREPKLSTIVQLSDGLGISPATLVRETVDGD